MKLSPRIQQTEKYYCIKCAKYYAYIEVHQTWKCIKCDNVLYRKVLMKDRFQTCQVVRPEDLKIDELITFGNDNIHRILNIENNQDNYRTALEKYKTIDIDKNSFITRIIGSWTL